jgi:hypothetical protein
MRTSRIPVPPAHPPRAPTRARAPQELAIAVWFVVVFVRAQLTVYAMTQVGGSAVHGGRMQRGSARRAQRPLAVR